MQINYRWRLREKGKAYLYMCKVTFSEIIFFRVDYLEKSKYLQNQLRELRSEIAVLKVGEKQTELDQLHDEQVKHGENKYSTLKKSKSGSTKSRVAFFEEL